MSLSLIGQKISSFDRVPEDIERLDISDNLFTTLEGVPITVRELRCSSNKISSLIQLRNLTNLISLGASFTHIKTFDGCPSSIRKVVAAFCKLETMQGLPDPRTHTMDIVYISYNKIKDVSYCPSVKILDLSANLLESIEGLPEGIETLIISNNPTLREIPTSLPRTLRKFRCSGCTNLPCEIYKLLPQSIELVECSKTGHEKSPQIKLLIERGVEVIY